MAAIFSQILNMSMTGSVVILLVMLARLLLKRAPKIFSYALWPVVLFRLLCPVAFTAPISVLDAVEPEMKETSNNTSIVSYIPETVNTQADFIMVQPEAQPVQMGASTEPEDQLLMTSMHAVALVWAAGAVGMLLYSVVQYLLLRRKLIGAMQLNGNIYLADHIDTAFVVGVVNPRIYLPSSVPEKERYYILEHEQHHIRRFDHVIKLLAYLALCIHWFNPLVWIAFILAGKDMEMSCDEAVIKKLGEEIRADYSASLLRLATHKKILSGMPLAFGEGDTKGRVLNMTKWKKPAKWVVAICVLLCLLVVVVCAFNPEEERTIEELTRHTSEGPVGTGIGDLYFTYPAGLTSEMREVENWTKEEAQRARKGLPNRSQWDHFFIDNGVDFGGVADFLLPEDRKIQLEELNLPAEWMGLDYVSESSAYPYVEMEYTLIKDGKDYIQLYLYTYSGRGYFLWFYTDQGNPTHKQAILQSVEVGSNGRTVTKLKQNEEISLGLFNVTIPKGYGYYRNYNVVLEITQRDFRGNVTLLGCVTARPNPGIPIDSEGDLKPWVEAVGIELADDGVSHSYQITDEGPYGDVQLFMESAKDSKYKMAENHYFFISGDIVYDLYFNALKMDSETEETILKSIWIKEPVYMPAKDKWITSLGNTPVTIGQLPDGYNYGLDAEQNIVFAWGNNAVGGVKSYPIPAGLYDPEDKVFHWLEEMGIPDFEDPNLIYLGGITSGDNGWAAEFADNLDDEAKRTVHRRHTFQVVGDTLYDIWFDMLNISFDNAYEIRKAVILPQTLEETESYMPTVPGDDIVTDIQLVQYGDFQFALPDGMESLDENSVITLTMDAKTVGGIALRKQEQPNSPNVFSPAWMTEIGIPEASDTAMGYMSSGSKYADYEITYFPDVPVNRDDNGNIIPDEQGKHVLENEVTHYLFVKGTDVYDIWFYINRIPIGMRETVLKTCILDGVTDIEAMQSALSEEKKALQQCRSVLEQIQSSSAQKIETKQENGSFALNETSMSTAWIYGDDRLDICIIPESGGASLVGRLLVDGVKYECGSTKEWREITWWDYIGPWLVSFQWDDAVVAYLDSLTDESGTTVMLRIDQPFAEGENQQPHYFVNFNYDADGKFRNVYVQTNVFMNNAISKTESIASLDAEQIEAEIQKEQQNAFAYQAIMEMGAGAVLNPQ